jgi:hypothetical protein
MLIGDRSCLPRILPQILLQIPIQGSQAKRAAYATIDVRIIVEFTRHGARLFPTSAKSAG